MITCLCGGYSDHCAIDSLTHPCFLVDVGMVVNE